MTSAATHADIVWDGGEDGSPTGLWSWAGNWSNDTVPTAADSVLFDLDAGYDVLVNAPASVSTATIADGDLRLFLDAPLDLSSSLQVAGGHLTILGGVVSGAALQGQIGVGASLNISGGTLTTSSLNAAGLQSMSFTSGTIDVHTGVFSPKLGDVVLDIGGQLITTTQQGYVLSGAAGLSATPTLHLRAGGKVTSAGPYAVIGNRGGRGQLQVIDSGSRFSIDGNLDLGSSLLSTPSGLVRSEGIADIRNGAAFEVGGTLSVSHYGAIGTLTVDGVGSRVAAGTLYVGTSAYITSSISQPGSGLFQIAGGAIVTASDAAVGSGISSGVVDVAGTGSLFAVDNILTVGGGTGLGTLNISSGASATGRTALTIGLSGAGRVNVSGSDSSLKCTAGMLTVGYTVDTASSPYYRVTDGQMNIENGGLVSSSDHLRIGYYSKGTVTVDGPGSRLLSTGGMIRVGQYRVTGATNRGEGTLSVTGGALASAKSNVELGYYGGKATVIVTGAGSILRSETGGVIVGDDEYVNLNSYVPGVGFTDVTPGEATLDISAGGQVSGFTISIGSRGGIGTVTLDGPSSSMQSAYFYIGSGPTPAQVTRGTISVTNGAAVFSGSSSVNFFAIGAEKSIARATLSSTGPTSRWIHTGSAYLGRDPDARVGTGTIELKTGSLMTISGTMAIAAPSGTSSNLLGGSLLLSGGEFRATTILNAGLIKGAGPMTGSLTNTGIVEPGAPIGRILLSGRYTQSGAASVLKLDLGGTGAGQFDQLSTTGPATLAGSIAVSLINGFVPTPGMTFGVLSYSSRTGDLAILNSTGYAGLSFTKTYSSTVLTLTAAARRGDINLDSRVDFADLLVLAQHYGTPAAQGWFDGDLNGDAAVGFDDLLIIAQNYDVAASAGDQTFKGDWILARTVVPEPAMVWILGVFAASAGRTRRPLPVSA